MPRSRLRVLGKKAFTHPYVLAARGLWRRQAIGARLAICAILHAQELSMRTSENRTNRKPDPAPGSSLGVCHTVLKIWTAIKLLPEDESGAKRVNLPLLGKALSGRRALFDWTRGDCVRTVGHFSWHVSQ